MTTVQEMIPVQEILKTYISQVEQVDVESIADETEEAEDPDIEEGEYEEPEAPVPEPEPEPVADANGAPEHEQVEEEHKEIPITGRPHQMRMSYLMTPLMKQNLVYNIIWS